MIRTPDFARVPAEQVYAWYVAANLLKGEPMVVSIAGGEGLHVTLESEVDVDDTFAVTLQHLVHVGEQLVDLGHFELLLEQPTLVRREPVEGGFHHVFTTADGTFTQRMISIS